jgi:hypothetical protein
MAQCSYTSLGPGYNESTKGLLLNSVFRPLQSLRTRLRRLIVVLQQNFPQSSETAGNFDR